MDASVTKDTISIPEFLTKHSSEKPVEFMNPPIIDGNDTKHVKCVDASRDRIGMSTMERESFISKVKGMTDEQLELMLEIVPIGLIYDRLGKELCRNQEIINSLSATMSLINPERMQ